MKIYIDYDNTLINLIDPWILWANNKFNVNFTSNDINRWHFLGEVLGKGANDFWNDKKDNHYANKNMLQPNPGAIKFLHSIQKQFGEKNVFIVSSTVAHHKVEKIKHAQYFFGIVKKQFISVNENKGKHTFTKGGILIDDCPLYVMEHICYNHQMGIVFNYNDSFGWCQKDNYILDSSLNSFRHIVDYKNFSIATSYKQIIEEINHA